MSIVAQFYPNGEFSHGVDTSKQRRDKQRRDTEFKPPLNKERRDAYLQWFSDGGKQILETDIYAIGTEFVSRTGCHYFLDKQSQNETCLKWQDNSGAWHTSVVLQSIHCIIYDWGLVPLVHQTVESCEKRESRKKLLSMTRPMARNIRNAVYLLEQQPGGKDLLSFLTLTLPALSPEGLAKCCEKWDYMVKRFMDWLRTRLEACNVEFQYVYCTEIQTKRLQIRHEYAPHLHCIFKGRNAKKATWAITPKQARKAWGRCIRSVVDESFDTSALENLQRIKFSAARYLSKYMSKGGCSIPDGTDEAPVTRLKTQWGGMSTSLSREIRRKTQRFGGSAWGTRLVVDFLDFMEEFLRQGFVTYYKAGFIAIGIDKVTGMEYGLHVGCGCLRTPTSKGGLVPIIEYIERHRRD